MKILRPLIGIIILTLIIIQFFPTLNNVNDEVPTTDVIQTRKAPSQVATLMHNACYDCHSNNTKYPWYNQIQPFAWILERDIIDGKRDLNFNEFETLSPEKQKKKFKEMKKSIEENEMPPASYKIFHSEARLTSEEKNLFSIGLRRN